MFAAIITDSRYCGVVGYGDIPSAAANVFGGISATAPDAGTSSSRVPCAVVLEPDGTAGSCNCTTVEGDISPVGTPASAYACSIVTSNGCDRAATDGDFPAWAAG